MTIGSQPLDAGGPRVIRGRFAQGAALGDARGDRRLERAIRSAQQGDRDAIRYIYVRFADNVYGYARSIVRDEHEAEDVTQHVFANLMTSIHKYEQRAVPFSAWILRVTHNLAIDHMRRRRAVPCEEVRTEERAPYDPDRQYSACLREALSRLPLEQREVLVMRHVMGLTPGEIAGRLGKSEGSIHGLHHRGRRTLKAALIELDAAPATA
jgi:RNA polymerase sigma-70 factor (ECF subfamily)